MKMLSLFPLESHLRSLLWQHMPWRDDPMLNFFTRASRARGVRERREMRQEYLLATILKDWRIDANPFLWNLLKPTTRSCHQSTTFIGKIGTTTWNLSSHCLQIHILTGSLYDARDGMSLRKQYCSLPAYQRRGGFSLFLYLWPLGM